MNAGILKAWVGALALGVVGCSMSTFDELRAAAWSDSNGPVGVSSRDFGVVVNGVTTDTVGATIVALGTEPLGLGGIRYDESGALEQFGVDLPSEVQGLIGSSPTLAGSPVVIDEVGGLAAVGGLGSSDTILLYDMAGSEPILIGNLTGDDCGAPGDNLGEKLVFRENGTEGSIDLLAVRGDEVFLFPDLVPGADAPSCFHCRLGGQVQDLVVGELVLQEEPPEEGQPANGFGEEAIVSFNGTFAAFFPENIQPANDAECFLSASPLFEARGPLHSGEPEPDFAAEIAVGDVDDNGVLDFAFTAPSSQSVYTLLNFDTSSPIAGATPLVKPVDSPGFGTGPIAFLELDTEVGDELVVGDPSASPDGVSGAGQVTVFAYSEDGVLERRAVLHDSDPVAGQGYGRALGGAEFVFGEDDADVLLTSAEGEVFTLFRSLSSGIDPRQ